MQTHVGNIGVVWNDAQKTIESSIQYYAMGAGRWNTTKVRPPERFSTERLYFAEHNTLNTARLSAVIARDSYMVDFTASIGEESRWATGFGGGDVVYPDRAHEDRKLLVYDSSPLNCDLEITGSPMLTLEMSSTTTDGALHAYQMHSLTRGKDSLDPELFTY